MSRRVTTAFGVAIVVVVVFLAVILFARFLEWLFGPQPILWVVLVFLFFGVAGLIYVLDVLTEGKVSGGDE